MKESSHRPITIVLLGAILLAIHTGCGSTKVENQTNSSVGQQLLDLEKAHNQGVISDQEYEKLKKAIVKKHD
jgi:hypothetical protein